MSDFTAQTQRHFMKGGKRMSFRKMEGQSARSLRRLAEKLARRKGSLEKVEASGVGAPKASVIVSPNGEFEGRKDG